MDKKQKFSIWYVILGIWAVLIIHNMIYSAFAIKTVPYSEFLNLLKENKVSEVAIGTNQIQGKIRNDQGTTGKDTLFRTVRVDPDTSKLLEEYGVTFKGEIESRFFANLFSWLLPIFIFFGIWYFMMRRMSGQQPGFMTLGKNKAKIFMQEDIDIRFSDPIDIAGYISPKHLEKELSRIRTSTLDNSFFFQEKMRKEAFSIMQEYMGFIYGIITINHDHLFFIAVH